MGHSFTITETETGCGFPILAYKANLTEFITLIFPRYGTGGRMKRPRTGFLCAKRASSARKNKGGGTYPKGGGGPKGRMGPPFGEHGGPEGDSDAASAAGTSAEDIIIYEEVRH